MLNRKLNITGIIFNFKTCSLIPAYMFMVIFLLFIGNIPARGQLISISSRFDTTSIWIGEQTNFVITLEQPEDMHVSFPALSDTLSGEIEILYSIPPDTLKIDNNKLRIINRYRITSFEPGDHKIKPLPFVFFIDEDEKVLYTSRASLKVLSPEIDETAEIYDIKAPFDIPVGIFEVLRIVLPGILILFLFWFLFRYFKRKKENQPFIKSEKPPEPAHYIALRELKQLREASLWQQGLIKEYYTRLTEIIRMYIERRFRIAAMEQTSEEIMRELTQQEVLSKEMNGLLQDCFLISDLVKFAKANPGQEDHEKCLNTAFRFVKETFETKMPDGDQEQEKVPDVSEVKV